MAALQHVYVTAHGKWTAAPWADERAQMGLRLAVVTEGEVPAKGAPFTIPAGNGEVELDGGVLAGTHGTLSRTWKARMGPVGSVYNADAARQVDIAEDVWTFLNAIKGMLHNSWSFTHVKIAPILADGKYGFPGAASYDFSTPIVGTTAGTPLPPEVAVAVSLRAPISGRTGRGRMYVPGIASTSLATNGTVISNTRDALALAGKTLLNSLDDAPGLDVWGLVTMVTSAGKATAVRPSQIRVGDHFDAQRRRQHQAVETYTAQTL